MSFWNNHNDADLSPLRLAEKKYMLAVEDQQRFNRGQFSLLVAQSERRTTGSADFLDQQEKIQAIQQAMDDEAKRVKELWVHWVGLKHWVAPELKAYHGCDPAKCDNTQPEEMDDETFRRLEREQAEQEIARMEMEIKRLRESFT